MAHIGFSWLHLAHNIILVGYSRQAQTAISSHSLFSGHCVLTSIMTVLTMDNMESA